MNEIDPELKRKLDLLKETPSRDAQKERAGRAHFLQEAQSIAPTVTQNKVLRHKKWLQNKILFFGKNGKEHQFMFNLLSVIIIAVSLILGGGGVTVAAAQTSQPDEPLYAVKLWSEDARLDLAPSVESQFQLALEFTDRRAEEIQTMLNSAKTPSEEMQSRYQAQLQQAFQFALQLPDEKAIQALQQISTRMQAQLQVLEQVQNNQSPSAEATLLRTRTMLQERLNWLESGLSDPQQFMNQNKQQAPVQNTPGTDGGNPWVEGTPTPGSGYGPGPGTGACETCTPSGNGQGSNPWTTGTPTPGSGYGPGPQPTNNSGQQGGKH